MREPSPLPIIDTHQHLWDLAQLRLPWLEGDLKLNRCFLPDDYARAAQGLNIVKTVYMEVDVHPSNLEKEARSILDQCDASKGTIPAAAVIGGRPDSEDFGRYLDLFRDRKPLKGVRRVLHSGETPAGYALRPEFVRGIRLLGERGLSFDLCIRSSGLKDAAKLTELCPDTRFILDHCGNPSVKEKDLSSWREDLKRIADRPNLVACKVSGIVASAAPGPWKPSDLAPIVNHVLDTFGPDRVIFGGDWPVCTLAASLAEWVTALRSIVSGRPEADRRKLFHDNAARIYALA